MRSPSLLTSSLSPLEAMRGNHPDPTLGFESPIFPINNMGSLVLLPPAWGGTGDGLVVCLFFISTATHGGKTKENTQKKKRNDIAITHGSPSFKK